jgi:hypothetical protein
MSLDFSGLAGAIKFTFTLDNAAGGKVAIVVDGAQPVDFDAANSFLTPSLPAGQHTIQVEVTVLSAVGGTADLYVKIESIGGLILHPYGTNNPSGNPFSITGLTTNVVPSTAFSLELHLV